MGVSQRTDCGKQQHDEQHQLLMQHALRALGTGNPMAELEVPAWDGIDTATVHQVFARSLMDEEVVHKVIRAINAGAWSPNPGIRLLCQVVQARVARDYADEHVQAVLQGLADEPVVAGGADDAAIPMPHFRSAA